MGSGLVAAFFGKKSAEKTNELKERPSKRQGQPIERRPPVTTVSELVAVGPEGFERIQFALDFAPLGTSLRWNKLLSALNRHIEPTEDVPDPLRVDFSMDEMKKGLNMLFKRTTLGRGYELAQEIVPAIYDKHSFERAKRVSQRERNAIPLPDECFAYGELGLPQFALIYYKICAAYGNIKGNFYDLGCGVGNLVYAAAILGSGNFQRCIGVENINALAERGTKRLLRWQKYAEKLPSAYQTITIDFVQDNIFLTEFWTEAFSLEERRAVTNTLYKCKEGTIVVALSHPVPNDDFETLVTDRCDTSWGTTNYFVQEKLTLPHDP